MSAYKTHRTSDLEDMRDEYLNEIRWLTVDIKDYKKWVKKINKELERRNEQTD